MHQRVILWPLGFSRLLLRSLLLHVYLTTLILSTKAVPRPSLIEES